MEPPREPSRRLFFAFWPTLEQQTACAEAALEAVEASGGRAVPAGNIHLTLVFLGSVPEGRVAELRAVARRIASSVPQRDLPLSVGVERLEHWKSPRVLCAVATSEADAAIATDATSATGGATDPTSATRATGAITRLADALRIELVAAGFTPDLKPFRAHVTLARKVQRGSREPAMHRVVWSFSAFALVESRTEAEGALYSTVESWDLCKAREAPKNSE